jgi:hypothetical protein
VAGAVFAGVEAGCLLLDADAVEYLLLGGDRATLEPGRRVVARATTPAGPVAAWSTPRHRCTRVRSATPTHLGCPVTRSIPAIRTSRR